MKRCLTCNNLTKGRLHTPGSFLVELVLWGLFIVPGLIYSLYRLHGRKKICTKCGSSFLMQV